MNIENTHLSPLGICNAALSKIGEKPIASLSPNYSSSAGLCHLHYHPSRRETLTMARWTFATQQTSLTSFTQNAPFNPRYLHQFRLPADCLRVLDVEQDDWILQGKYMLAHTSPIRFTYIADEEKCENFDPLFTEAFATLLASKLAVPLTTSQSLRQTLSQEFHKVILPLAATTNAVQSFSNDSNPLWDILRRRRNSLNCE